MFSAKSILKSQTNLRHERSRRSSMLLIPAVLLMASCGGRDVVYVQVPESAPSTTNAPITSLPKVTNAPSEEIDFLGLSNVEFLANAWLALRSGDGGDYCYTDCSYINLPDVWIERAGGGLIDNEEVWNWIMFITSKPVSEISEYCDMFYATADADIGAIALESGVDPKAMIVGGYVICDS